MNKSNLSLLGIIQRKPDTSPCMFPNNNRDYYSKVFINSKLIGDCFV